MTSSSPHLGLVVPSESDRFSTTDLADNWQKLDAAPGTHVCTSTTRPSWGLPQAGRDIIETNTGLRWLWTGTGWSRETSGLGLLKISGGTDAVGERTTDFSSASTTFVKVVSIAGVVVPAGNRPIEVVVQWKGADNATGAFDSAVFRSNTNNSGPQLNQCRMIGAASQRGPGGDMHAYLFDGIAAGSYDFSFQIRSDASIGGTSWVYADSVQPCRIAVFEK